MSEMGATIRRKKGNEEMMDLQQVIEPVLEVEFPPEVSPQQQSTPSPCHQVQLPASCL